MKHEPLISHALFDRVQEAIGFLQKPRLTKRGFPYAGLLINNPKIQSKLEQALENVGLSAQDAIRVIKRNLDATTESGHPDCGNQLKAADMTLKLVPSQA